MRTIQITTLRGDDTIFERGEQLGRIEQRGGERIYFWDHHLPVCTTKRWNTGIGFHLESVFSFSSSLLMEWETHSNFENLHTVLRHSNEETRQESGRFTARTALLLMYVFAFPMQAHSEPCNYPLTPSI